MANVVKPTRQEIDPNGKVVKLKSAIKWLNGKIGKTVNQVGRKKMVKMLKQAGPEMIRMVKW